MGAGFDLTRVRFSVFDLKRGIKVPETYSEDLAEETAIHLGDGYLFYDEIDGSYRYGVGLNPRKEIEYTEYVRSIIKRLYGYAPRPRNGRIEFMSLAVGTFKRFVLRFPLGTRDGTEGIPNVKWVLRNEKYATAFVRGLIDTEGSVKRQSRTLALVVKMRNKEVILLYNKCLELIGFNPKLYSWIEKGKPIYASVVLGKSNVKSLIHRVDPRNPLRLTLI